MKRGRFKVECWALFIPLGAARGEAENYMQVPVANPQAIVSGSGYRFTISPSLDPIRMRASDGVFGDRAPTFAINRHFPTPRFRVVGHDDVLKTITDHYHLCYDKACFSPAVLVVHFNCRHTDWGAPWHYGLDEKLNLGGSLNLGGTSRTLDLCNGHCH